MKSNDSGLNMSRNRNVSMHMGKASVVQQEVANKDGDKYNRKGTISSDIDREGEESEDDLLQSNHESNVSRCEAKHDDMPSIHVIEEKQIIAGQSDNFTFDKSKAVKMIKKRNSKCESTLQKTKNAESSSILRIESSDSFVKKFIGRSKGLKKQKSKSSKTRRHV